MEHILWSMFQKSKQPNSARIQHNIYLEQDPKGLLMGTYRQMAVQPMQKGCVRLHLRIQALLLLL